MTFPLVLHLGDRVPATPSFPRLSASELAWAGSQPGGGALAAPTDPFQQAWLVAWGGHALRDQPGHFFQSNAFWPLADSLAFTDALAGYAPAGLVGSGPRDALFRYGVLYILSFALAVFGAYALARELGAGPGGAAVAGAAWGFAPWRIAQGGHLHVLSAGGIALALYLLIGGYRRRSPVRIVAGWLVAAWQVSLGFSLGLQFLYLLALLGAGFLLYTWRRRLRPERRVVVATLGGIAVLAAVTFVIARPYFRVLDEYPESERTIATVRAFSPPLRGLVSAPRHDVVWGALTSSARSGLTWPDEQAIFPGLVIVVLALIGAVWGRVYPRALRLGLVAGALVIGVLSLGLGPGRWMPYRLLYELAPEWSGVRTPGRLVVLVSLCLALLAAAGAQALAARTRRANAVAALLVVLVLAEGFGALPLLRAPSPPPALAGAPAPVFFLPSAEVIDPLYQLWSTRRFAPLVNGGGGFISSYLLTMRHAAADFPSRRSVALFRKVGVRTVVLDKRVAAGTPWERIAARPVAGLPLARRDSPAAAIYELNPPPLGSG